MVSFLPFSLSHLTSISQSKCPTLQTIESLGSWRKCSPRTMPLQPVVVTMICAFDAYSSSVATSYPAIYPLKIIYLNGYI